MLGDRRVEQSDANSTLAGANESSHKIGGDRSAGQGVDGYDAQAAAVRRVGCHADHGNLRAGSPPYPRPQYLRTTWESDNPIHTVPNGRFERFLFAFAEMRIRTKLDLDIFQRDGSGFCANPSAHLVPKRRGPLERVDRNAERLFGGQVSGGEVRAVSQGSGHLQDPRLGHGTDARSIVQGAMYRTDGSA